VQPTCPPVDANFFELFLMIDAFKRASAKRITTVLAVLWVRASGSQRQAPRPDFIEGGVGFVGRVWD
jgi:phosphoribosylpyrophosphate synthetase